jgi:Cu-Zn family superoxide dismutase
MNGSVRLMIPAVAVLLLGAPLAAAADLHAAMHKAAAEGTGESVGDVTVTMSNAGAVFRVNLKGLPPGPHGFHVHENGNCGATTANGARVLAGAAGGHWDTNHSGKHEGPTGAGHIGDLPVLTVASNGTATESLTAPRIKTLDSLKGHALIIHAGGDNYSDQPAPLGGGGARLACGVLE